MPVGRNPRVFRHYKGGAGAWYGMNCVNKVADAPGRNLPQKSTLPMSMMITATCAYFLCLDRPTACRWQSATNSQGVRRDCSSQLKVWPR